MDDNGYDIADYQAIVRLFLEPWRTDHLIAQKLRRDILLSSDTWCNHTSDEHAWFVEACENTDSPERDYFIWRAMNPDIDSLSLVGPLGND